MTIQQLNHFVEGQQVWLEGSIPIDRLWRSLFQQTVLYCICPGHMDEVISLFFKPVASSKLAKAGIFLAHLSTNQCAQNELLG